MHRGDSLEIKIVGEAILSAVHEFDNSCNKSLIVRILLEAGTEDGNDIIAACHLAVCKDRLKISLDRSILSSLFVVLCNRIIDAVDNFVVICYYVVSGKSPFFVKFDRRLEIIYKKAGSCFCTDFLNDIVEILIYELGIILFVLDNIITLVVENGYFVFRICCKPLVLKRDNSICNGCSRGRILSC